MAGETKILVIRLSSIGDIILTTPLLRSLRESYPMARITYLIKKQYAELLADSLYIDELILLDKAEGFRGLRKIKQKLKERRFDICLDIHKNLRSLYLRLGIGIPRVTTYPKYIFKRTMLVRFKLNLYKNIKPVYLRYFESVQKLGIKYDGKGTDIRIPLITLVKIRDMISGLGFDSARPLVIICPAATYLNKQWKKRDLLRQRVI